MGTSGANDYGAGFDNAGRHLVSAIGEWQASVSASIATDPEWVSACAKHGLRVGVDGGVDEVSDELERLFSKRNIAIEAKLEELREEFIGANHRALRARVHWWIKSPESLGEGKPAPSVSTLRLGKRSHSQ